jgi:hypothetical protein
VLNQLKPILNGMKNLKSIVALLALVIVSLTTTTAQATPTSLVPSVGLGGGTILPSGGAPPGFTD